MLTKHQGLQRKQGVQMLMSKIRNQSSKESLGIKLIDGICSKFC